MPRLTDEQSREIIAARGKGATLGQLAARFGVTRSTVSRVVAKATKPPSQDTTHNERTVTFRMPLDELRAFDAWCGQQGLSRSEALRAFVRDPSGRVVVDHELRENVEALRAELRPVGTNLNQIARRLNAAARKGQLATYDEADRETLRQSWRLLDRAARGLEAMLARLPKLAS